MRDATRLVRAWITPFKSMRVFGPRFYFRLLSFLKTRPSRSSCGLRRDPLLAGDGQMAWDPCWDTAFRDSHAPGVGAGEPRTSATARGLEGAPAVATAEGFGPDLLGRAVEALEELAEVFACGAAGDRGAVARRGFRRYWAWKSRRRRGRPMIS